MKPYLLLVEDDAAIRDMVSFALRRAEFELATASDTVEAQREIARRLPDLILLDWMLPSSQGGSSGLEFAKRLRRDALTREVPIVMLTARGEEDDRVLGLDSGVDDYVVKPFSPRELISRVRAVLRRGVSSRDVLTLGRLVIDVSAQRVMIDSQTLALGPSEYRLLHFLAARMDRVYTRAQLLDSLWGSDQEVEERTVDVLVGRLRKALEPFGCERYVQTVRGSGYRLSLG
jgi:two-component system, OmpR family, phosphate regulon response regulator PhoB